MNKKDILKSLQEIVQNSKEYKEEEFTQLIQIIQENYENIEQKELLSILYEAKGDTSKKFNKAIETEKNYNEMLKHARNCFEIDHEQGSYRYGFSSYKLANFYRSVLRFTNLIPKPIELNENQKKLFQATEINYKNAIAIVMKSEEMKKGNLRYLELISTSTNELAILYSAIGNYQNAIAMAKDGIRIDQSIYEKLKDKAHCFLYGNRLNQLAQIYVFMKNIPTAIETFEKSVTILNEHKNEEPITYGILLSKNYLHLGNCYSLLKQKQQLAPTAFQHALDYMENVNIKTNNGVIFDLIQMYMVVGNYYKRTNKVDQANRYYKWAMEHSKEMFEKTSDKKYEGVITHLQTLLDKE